MAGDSHRLHHQAGGLGLEASFLVLFLRCGSDSFGLAGT